MDIASLKIYIAEKRMSNPIDRYDVDTCSEAHYQRLRGRRLLRSAATYMLSHATQLLPFLMSINVQSSKDGKMWNSREGSTKKYNGNI